MPVVPGSAKGTVLRWKQAEVIEFPAHLCHISVVCRFDPPVLDASKYRRLQVVRVTDRVADDSVILPQTMRHLVGPQSDGISVFNWGRDATPRLVYERDAQGEASLLSYLSDSRYPLTPGSFVRPPQVRTLPGIQNPRPAFSTE